MRITLAYYYIAVKQPIFKVLRYLSGKILICIKFFTHCLMISSARLSIQHERYDRQIYQMWMAIQEHKMTDEEHSEFKSIKKNAGL